jgi:hypothetical protein
MSSLNVSDPKISVAFVRGCAVLALFFPQSMMPCVASWSADEPIASSRKQSSTMSQAAGEVMKNTKHDHRLATALVDRFSFGFGLVPSRDPAGGTSYFPHKKKKLKKARSSPIRD